MANLLDNGSLQYKGILNLHTLNGGLISSLQTIEDGQGNATGISVSTTLTQISNLSSGSLILDSADVTKRVALSTSGITAGKTMTLLFANPLDATITFPSVTGTLATLAGSEAFTNKTGNISQWTNNSGYITSLSGAALLASANIFTTNGALSAPSNTFNGTWITGGSATTTKPYVLIETTGATSTGWSTSGTGFGINAASGFTGLIFDFQLNGSSVLNVNSTGTLRFNGGNTITSPFHDVITLTGFSGVSIGSGSNELVANNGRVSIGRGLSTALGLLHLSANTSGLAAILFTQASSALLGTLLVGAFEFVDDGTTGHLYITRNVVGVATRTLIV